MQSDSKPVFMITEEDVQREAVQVIGRRLNEDEIEIVAKGMECGLTFDIDTVYTTAILEAVEISERKTK